MTFTFSRPIKGRTRFGIFHNIAPIRRESNLDVETRYIHAHFFGAMFGVYWEVTS